MTAAARLPTEPHQAVPSPKQSIVLRYLAKHQRLHGWMPTRKEILVELGVNARSLNYAQEALHALEAKGFIMLGEKVARGIRITAHGKAWLEAERRKEKP